MAVLLKDIINKYEESPMDLERTNTKKKNHRRKRKRRKYFYSENFNDNDISSIDKKRPPFKEYKDFEDYDYEIDFYEDKNYEYIDQDHVESLINHNFVSNNKIGNAFNESGSGKFKFEPIDYSNYDYVEVGNLNFRSPDHDDMRYRRIRYKPRNKIFFSKRKLRKFLIK